MNVVQTNSGEFLTGGSRFKPSETGHQAGHERSKRTPRPYPRVEWSWHQLKFEALRRSRFERTIYIDTDVIALADLSDVFDVLDRFDITGARTDGRGNKFNAHAWRSSVPSPLP